MRMRASVTKLRITCVGMGRPCGLMDKALVFGTTDCRFESCQGHAQHKEVSLAGLHKAAQGRGPWPQALFAAISAIAREGTCMPGLPVQSLHDQEAQDGVSAHNTKLRITCVGSRRPCGLMDKALVFGTKDYRFESCQGHGVV